MRKQWLLIFCVIIALVVPSLTFSECSYVNVVECPNYSIDSSGRINHSCLSQDTSLSRSAIMGECQYYDFSYLSDPEPGWYMYNNHTGDYIPCDGYQTKAKVAKVEEFISITFKGNGQLELTIFEELLKLNIEKEEQQEIKDEKNDKYHTNILKNFRYIGIDPNRNRINIKVEAYTAKYSFIPLIDKKIRDYYVCADIDAYLVPKIKNVSENSDDVEYDLIFETGVEKTDVTKFGGWKILAGTFTANMLIAPAIQAFGPSLAPIINGILTTGTSPGVINLLTEIAAEYAAENAPMEEQEFEQFQIYWSKIKQYDRYGFFEPYVRLNSDGLIFGLNFDITKTSLIYDEIIDPFNKAIGDNTLTTLLDQVQDIAFENLGHFLNEEELALIIGITGQGIGAVKEHIISSQEAYEHKFMKGFDLDKFNSNQNMLIISLAGAGPFNSVAADSEEELIGLETLTGLDIPKSSKNYDDEIYQLPAYHLDENTIAVIGYPWLSTAESMQMSEEAYLPNIDRFSIKIKDALNKMAEDRKLILIGKSMGGAQLEKVTHSLNALNVPVDLLVMVDPSARVSDQSGSIYTRQISSNVKKVYNYRQINVFPENDMQNGFPISFTSPTIGEDIIVGAENSDIGVLQCEGVGHDDIDECEWLLNKIDRLIAQEKGISDISPIVNNLLLD